MRAGGCGWGELRAPAGPCTALVCPGGVQRSQPAQLLGRHSIDESTPDERGHAVVAQAAGVDAAHRHWQGEVQIVQSMHQHVDASQLRTSFLPTGPGAPQVDNDLAASTRSQPTLCCPAILPCLSGMKSWPRVCILSSGVRPAVSPKSYSNTPCGREKVTALSALTVGCRRTNTPEWLHCSLARHRLVPPGRCSQPRTAGYTQLPPRPAPG